MRQHLERDADLVERDVAPSSTPGMRPSWPGEPDRGVDAALADRRHEARRAGRGRERVEHLVHRLRPRVHEVERAAVEPVDVHEVVHRVDHVVDRHHVRRAEVRDRAVASNPAAPTAGG